MRKAIPANLTPVSLPSCSPELNALEPVWWYLRGRFLCHRFWPSRADISTPRCAAWNALVNEIGRVRSLCTLDWATVRS